MALNDLVEPSIIIVLLLNLSLILLGRQGIVDDGVSGYLLVSIDVVDILDKDVRLVFVDGLSRND